MKINFYTIILFFLCSQVAAEQISQSDQLIEKISRCINSSLMENGKFEQQKHIKILKKPIKTSGEFYFPQDNHFIWKQQKPIQVAYHIEDSIIYRSRGGKKEKLSSVGSSAQSTLLNTMMAAMRGDFSSLSQSFAIDGKMQDENKGCQWQVTLTPNDKDLSRILSNIELTGTKQVQQVNVIEVSGDRTNIQIQPLVQNR